MKEKTSLGSKDHINHLKGLAILAVVGIHTVNLFTSFFPQKSISWNTLIILDQIFRFSVPVFVSLSGFALTKKYLHSLSSIRYKEFFFNRVLKLLPLYLVWSLIYYIFSTLIPGWSGFIQGTNLLKALVLGRSEFHLYFVPMIFQAYLLFPLIVRLVKRNPLICVLLSFVIQVFSYLITSKLGFSDQNQYILFSNWIFYFVVGIYLSIYKLSISIKLFGAILIIVGLYATITNAFNLVNLNKNIIDATKFTRIEVLIYSLGVITVGLTANRLHKVNNIILKIGENSYQIYLGHVLILHIISTILNLL